MIAESEPILEREQRLIELLARALIYEPDERRDFLETACAGDAGLFAEVWDCLGHEERLGDFLESPVVITAAGEPQPRATRVDRRPAAPRRWRGEPPARKPAFVGPYRVLELLGEGGMGRVYLAEQTAPVRRRVALKVIHSNLEHPERDVRFAAERQALARLSHPNVGQMLEAGTTSDGHPFFAMELVEGETIIRFCDREGLSVDARLELFVDVCRGVEHAHQKQILHRDLKPANILVTRVDRRPVPKIIDFGIAKKLDAQGTETPLSTGDGLIGTPAYMSPESLTSEEPDTRTDIYALGVVLYELLTGSRPYERPGVGLAQELRSIAEEEAPRPSARFAAGAASQRREVARRRRTSERALRRRLKGDLDAIVMKALARDRRGRYGAAAELAADVERHLRHEPTTAYGQRYGQRFGYLAAKLARRHRPFVAGAAVVAAALVLGVVGTSLGMVRAEREAAAARQARDEAEEVVDFLVDLFRASAPEAATGTPRPAAAITAADLLERGAERLASELADRPLTRSRLLGTIGVVHRQLGEYETSQSLLEQALELRRENLAADHPDIAEAHYQLGELLLRRGLLDEAEDHLRQARAIQEESLGPDDPKRAVVLILLGRLARQRGRYDDAEALHGEALALQERVLGGDHAEVAKSLNSLGNLYLKKSRYEDAERSYRRCLAIQRRTLAPGHPSVATTVNNLAIALASQGRLEEAAPLFREALEHQRAILGDEHPQVAVSLNNLGVLMMDLDRHAEAEPFHRQALAIREKALGPRHPMTAWSLHNLAVTLHELGCLDEAEPLHRRALAIREESLGPEHPDVAESFFQLGRLAEELGRPEEARQDFERALAIRDATLDPQHPAVGWSAWRLGELLLRRGERESGGALARRGLAILEARLPAGDEDLAAAQQAFAELVPPYVARLSAGGP